MKKVYSVLLAVVIALTTLTGITGVSSYAATENFTRGNWNSSANNYEASSADNFGHDFAVLHLGNSGKFTLNTTVTVKRDTNTEYGFIFGMKDLDGDGMMTQAKDEYYVIEHVGNQGRFGLQKVSNGTWPAGWIAKSTEETALAAGEHTLTLTVDGNYVELSSTKGVLISHTFTESITGGFGLCGKRTYQNFKNTTFSDYVDKDPLPSRQYGGNWRVVDNTYVSSTTVTSPNFAYYNLGTADSGTSMISVKGKVTLANADIGLMFGVSNNNGSTRIEENIDDYYLICVTGVSDAGKASVFIEKNAAKWGGSLQKYEVSSVRAGDKLDIEAIYLPETHNIKVKVNGEDAIDYTDSSSPISGNGFGLASKVAEGTITLEEVVVEGTVAKGKYYQARTNTEDKTKNDHRFLFVVDESEIADSEGIDIYADFVNENDKLSAEITKNEKITTVYSQITANDSGLFKNIYVAEEGAILFGAIVTGTPSGYTPVRASYSVDGKAPEAGTEAEKLESLKIDRTDISEFTIVYAAAHFNNAQISKFDTEYDFYRITAEKIADEIYEYTGKRLAVVRDRDTFTTEHEILVGPTNRTESSLYYGMSVYDFENTVKNGKLVIGGGYDSAPLNGGRFATISFAATYHAFEGISEYIDNGLKVGISKVDLAEGWANKGSFDFTTISCIGDSITEGAGATERTFTSYPAVLQRIFWQDHIVVNCGYSGRTMRSDLERRYKDTVPYNAALSIAYKADVTFIMLGTNDSYFDKSFSTTDDQRYLSDGLELAKALTDANPELKLTIMNCPPYYGPNTSADLHVRNLQADLVDLCREQGYSTYFFNMYDYVDDNLTVTRLPDLLHPNDDGYRIMARGLAAVIPSILDGSWDEKAPKIDESIIAPDDSKLASGAVNLMPVRLDTKYPVRDYISYDANANYYSAWGMSGAPYIFTDLERFEGYTITDIDMPVYHAAPGETFTVSVVRYTHPKQIEYVKSYTLTVTEQSGAGWISFHGLDIEVPEGCTLAFGSPSDSLNIIFLGKIAEAGYGFYGSVNGSMTTSATLAFNVYGKKG